MNNLEIINLSTIDGKLVAILSYQDSNNLDINNGYTTAQVPVNLREMQVSVRGNILVDQSVKVSEDSNVNIAKPLLCAVAPEEFVEDFTSDGELTPIDIVAEITGLTYNEIKSCSKVICVP